MTSFRVKYDGRFYNKDANLSGGEEDKLLFAAE